MAVRLQPARVVMAVAVRASAVAVPAPVVARFPAGLAALLAFDASGAALVVFAEVVRWRHRYAAMRTRRDDDNCWRFDTGQHAWGLPRHLGGGR